MDTRYWGPSGWRLLHLIAISPNTAKNKTVWEMLPFVLPCKFCRASLSDYYKDHPIPTEAHEFPKWLYIIHNCVNKKLRDQGQHLSSDPSFKEVSTHYKNYYKQGCTKTVFPGWEMLFSIADCHPDRIISKPMPDTPKIVPTTLKERNRYNLLTSEERKEALQNFWESFPDVLPFEEWKTSWKKYAGSCEKAIINRRSAMSWLWKIRCGLESDLQQLGQTNFHGLCKEVANYRSSCSTNRRARTCRSVKHSSRKTLRHKQR
jgi:hypothetical protein